MMSNNLITQANNIYLCSQQFQLDFMDVDSPALFAFSKQLNKFFYSIGEAREDDFWKERRRKLRRLAFIFSGIPSSKSFIKNELLETINYVELDIKVCERLYPSLVPRYSIILDEMKNLALTELDTIKHQTDNLICSLEGSIAILVTDTRLIPVVEETYSNSKVQVISVNSLRSNVTYDNLIVIGPTRWYLDFVFSSPRATNIFVIKFRWIKDSWKPKRVFPDSLVSTQSKAFVSIDDVLDETDDLIDPELFLPTIDFSSIIKSTWEHTEKSDTEFVEAIIGQLENDQIVFLDFDDASTIRIIDSEDENKPVKKIRVKDLTPEMFILLKTSGGGDYIIPLADKILGDRSIELRIAQRRWKNLLRDAKNSQGVDKVIDELIASGCSIANQANLRNWLSYRSIRTSKFLDFKAIMHLVGLDEQAETIWHEMGLIRKAHIQAGRHITHLLLKMVRESDLSNLMRLGIMEFELPDRDAGSITAYRIKALSDRNDTVLVPPTKIGIPLDVE